MVKRTITITTILLILTMAVGLIVMLNKPSFGADIASGTCGTCSWVIDSEGVLTISPTDGVSGTLDEFSYLDHNHDWQVSNLQGEIRKVVVEDGVKTGQNCYMIFCDFTNCTEMELSGLDTSNATSMSFMFRGCENLTSIDVSSFDTSNVTSMLGMFYNCKNLTSIDVSSFDTSNVTDMRNMFYRCNALTTLDVSGLDTSNVTDMMEMFESCAALTSLDVSGFDTSNVRDMSNMFSNCRALTTLNVSGFDTSNVKKMDRMFENCRALTTLDVTGFDTSEVTNMSCMFEKCAALTSLDVTGFDTSKVTSMGYMFDDCINLSSIDVSSFDTSNVTYMKSMFYGCGNLTSIDLSSFNTSKVTDMSYMFGKCTNLISINVSSFDTSNVTDMNSMFYECRNLTTLDVSGFNTSKVTNMSYMFNGCNLITAIDVSGFDTSNVTNMNSMFAGCKALATLDVSGFNTSNVTNMNSMFGYCTALTTLDVSGFDTSNVTDMSSMFQFCENLTSLDVSGFNTSKVTTMGYMFRHCKLLVSLDVSGFNTSNVTNMVYMFDQCELLTSLDVSGFDTRKVTNMNYMFHDCKNITYLDLSSFNTNNVSRMLCMLTPLDNLDTITLGENFSFDGRGNISDKAQLPTPTGERFTGKWIREDGAYGPYTPTELRDNYDGATMAGNWIRERKPLTVTYRYTGTVPQGASELPETRIYEVGENVTVEPDATAPGYTFNGWSRSGTFVMPEENVEITGSFTANSDTPYKVEHYVEDLNADTFSLRETENLEGETDSVVTAYQMVYEGFTFDNTVDGTVESGLISGEGDLVLKLYYTRNSYNVSYDYTNHVTGESTLPSSDSYEYQAEVTVAPNATAPGYTFSGWSRTGTFTMPAEDVEITGSFTANTNTPYKVEHYTKDLNANTYTLRETENKTGTTDTSVTATAKTYEGFTFDNSINGTVQSGYISGDGNLTLKLYYTRNSYTVSYAYTSAPVSASLLPADQSYQYGAEVTVAPDATASGYTFSGWNRTGTFTMPAEDVEITGSFTANTNTPYKIEHYTKDLNANTYTLRETENKTGTTDTLATANAKTYEGFTFNNSINGTVQSGYISGDGNLTLKLYYTRNSYTVSYAYTSAPVSASLLPADQSYEYGAEVTVEADATAPGYTFSGWGRTNTFTMPAEDVEITGSFTANTNTPYKIEHYTKDLNANTYTLRETENKTGTTDTLATANAKTYEGFTFNNSINGTVQSGYISGDGNLVLKLYYNRNSYTVSYEYQGNVPAGASSLPSSQSYEYGTEVTVAPDATALGYTFNGWNRTGTFTMPAEDVTIKGSFSSNTNTIYKVEHYKENINSDTYSLFETDTLAGETDTEVTATPNTYEGFTFNSGRSTTTGTITGDGNLVLKLYYNRNSYTVSYAYQGTVPTGTSGLPSNQNYEYGAEVTIAPDATAPGYTFSGWSRNGTFTMPAEDVEITGSFTANTNTPYKIEHYTKDLNANTYTLRETENKTGTTDTSVTATAKTYEGFTFDNSINGTVQSGYISGDGNLTLKLYYTRNSYTVSYAYISAPVSASLLPADQSYQYGAEVTVAPDATASGYTFSGWNRTGTFTMPAEDVLITGSFTANTNTPYKIEHYTKDLNANTYTLRETENKTGKTDTNITAIPKSYTGFTFNTESSTLTGTISGDGDLTLKLYYTRNSYTVSYAYQGTVPTGANSVPTSISYQYEAEVTVAPDATAPGYTFSGWSRTGTFTMPAEDVEITGSFTANTNTPYKIEHYIKDLGANTYTLKETENKIGTTDTSVTAIPKSYTGFTFNTESSTLTGTISGDGNLTLKLYYTRNSYTVSYAYQGNVPTGASSLPANNSYEFEAEVTVSPDATAPGYTFSGWSRNGTFTMPAEDVEITGRFTANTNTAYKIEHYKQNVNNDQFTLFETENKTGTTDNLVTAAAKIYEGFTFNNSINGTVQSGYISGDGNLTLKLYYTRNSYTVSYAYTSAPVSASLLPADSTYKYGAEVVVEPSATAPGYTFSGWSRTGTFEMPAEDVEITGSFTANTNTAYKIEHYTKDLNANTYTLKETENKTGTTDTLVTANSKNYEGFTFNNSISGTVQSGYISGDGNLTLKLYYTRNSYIVSYAYQGNVPAGASSLPANNSYEFGGEVTVAPDATAPGYTFSGWSRTGTFIMPAEDVTIKGSFASDSDTTYKVEHYKENINSNTYTLFETETLTGETDTEVTVTPNTYTGFTFNSGRSTTTGTISGDGNLTLKLYYNRNSYIVSYAYQGTVPTGASNLQSSNSYEYEAEVTVASDATAPGYTFSGWSRTGTFTMPAEDVEITGSFIANTNTSYKVEHYTKDLNARTYTLKETENRSGTTDTSVTAIPKTYEGFSFDSGVSSATGIVSGNGNLVLKLYYNRNSYTVSYAYQGTVPIGASSLPVSQSYEYEANVTVEADSTAPGYTFSGWSRTGTFTMPAEDLEITGSFTANTDTPYKVEHYTKDLNANTYTLRETENKTGTTSTNVTATAKSYEGFTFNAAASIQTGTISGDGNLTLKLYYNRNSYIVSYAYQGTVPTGASSLPASQSYEYGAEVTVNADATAPGYTFSGWSRTGTFTMPAEDIEITGSFTSNNDTNYKVEHYKQNVNNDQFTLFETENKTGTTDTSITATPKSYVGFTFDNTIPGTSQSGTISGDGNLTLKLYYTRNSYTVSYAYTSAPVSASLLPADSTYKYEEEVTVAADGIAAGYTFSGWSRTGTFTMPAEDVEITGSFTANTNTSYKVEHYTKDLNATNYSLRETENKTGTTDSFVTATAKTYEGFTFNNSISGTVQSGYISGDGNLILKLYYTRNSYTVSYEYQGYVPTGASNLPSNQSYEYGAEVTVATNATAPGYTFNGWNRTGTFTMPAEDVTIKGSFSSNTNTTYKVEHYKENINSNDFTLFETDTLAGETDTEVTATPNTYTGFTFNSGRSTQTGTISGDGNLVLKLYYSRNSYTVSYAYQGTVPTGASSLPTTQSYEYGAEVTVMLDATAPGYTFSGWNRTGTFTMPAEDVEIAGSFTANTNTSYKIEHYIKDLNVNTYTLKETENKTGTTDTNVSANSKSYEGFTFDNTITGTIQSGTISGDGKLTLKLYYTRNSYNVSYGYTSAPVSASLLPADQNYEYGAEVTVAPNATAAGYTFSGWSRTGTFEMPAEDVEITGSFTANTNTPYKIEHYQQKINNDQFTLFETEDKTGTTDTLVTATAKTYEGFTFDNSINGTLQNGYISGDGNLTLKIYYTRNSYTVSYAYTSAPVSASLLPADTTYKYEAEVIVAPNATAAGYTFSGWSRTGTFTMPAEDVEITGSFTANTNTTYKVEHYTKDLNANTYTLRETENKVGTTDTNVTAIPKNYEGFTFDGAASIQTGTISGDGNLVLKLYYNRNSYLVSYAYQGTVPAGASSLPASQSYEYGAEVTVAPDATAAGYTFSGWSRTGTFTMPAEDVIIKGSFSSDTDTIYKVEHYKENINSNTYTLFETDTLSGETDTEVTATPNTYTGFTFNSGRSTLTGTISGDGNLVLKLYYDRNSYTVSYTYQGTVPTGASNLPANNSYEYEAEVTVAADSTATGYTFSGWSRTGTFTMPAENVEITGSFTANTNTPYKVEHYTKDLNDNTYSLRETENKTGTTDTNVTAIPKTYEGFSFDSGISSATGTISGNGNLTLKLYYTRNSYTVSYAYQGTVPIGASSLPVSQSYEYEANVTVVADRTAPGYTFNGWSRTGTFTMPAEDVEITGSFTANTNTPYKIEHYTKDLNANTYTLKETENKTGTTDTLATATAKTYAGFTFNNTITGTIQSGNISGDGNLTLKLYYTRNSYIVSYTYQDTVPTGASNLPASQSYEYEENVTVAPAATASGYTFSGWSRTGTFTMPAEDVEITGSFVSNNDTNYKVEHYKQNVNNNQFTLFETENKAGTTDTSITATPKSYVGFTFDNSIPGTMQTGTISGDGNLTLKLYYTRNSYTVSYAYSSAPVSASLLPADSTYKYEEEVTVAADGTALGYTFSGWSRTGTFTMPAEDVEITGSFTANTNTSYKIEHYTKDLNATNYSLRETENKTGTTDSFVTATAKSYEGFTFNNSISGTVQSGYISGDGNLTLKLYYTRNSYTVSYAYEGNVPTGASSLPASQSYEYGTEVIVASNATAPGYTFNGWNRTGTFTMPAEDVTIKGSFSSDTDTIYKVEHYKENINSDTYSLFETDTLSGETDTEVIATPNTYVGFTFDSGRSTLTGTISGDGNLVLKLYYSRNSYTVSYAYQGTVPTGASNLPTSQSYEYGADVTVAADSTATGYTFSGWSRTGIFTMLAEDVEITGSFTANTNTSYKVEHYTKDQNADTFTLKETENKTGTTDTEVTATPKNYEGFTFDAGASTQTGTITADGNLVLKLYYNRNSYSVSYTYQGTVPTGASNLPTSQSYEYGADVTVAADSTATGYTFSGWSRTGTFTMPAEDIEITGSFTTNTNTSYKIEHYTKDLNASTYTLRETENKSGTTDTSITATPKNYEGFTFDAGASTQTGTISGDGNLTLKLYYNRNSYMVSYEYQGNVPTGASSLPANQRYEYGAEVTVAADSTALGYTFSGWSRTGTFTMPAEDVEITGSFDANTNTAYKVEYYLEIEHSGEYLLKDEYILTGKTDIEVNAEVKDYSGYRQDDSIDGTKKTGIIAGDGSLVLKIYYKNTNYKYKVEYYFDGELDSALEEILEGEIDSQVSSNPVTPVRHRENSYTLVSKNHIITISSNNDDNIIKVYYETDVLDYEIDNSSEATDGDGIPDKYQIKINYKVENGTWDDGTTRQKTSIVTLRDDSGELSEQGTGELNAPQVGSKPTKGYTKGSWNPELPSKVSKANDGVEYKYSYKEQGEIEETTKEEPKTEITQKEAKSSNPKTQDIMHNYLLIGTAGVLVLMIVRKIRRKYSRKARDIQF